MKTIALRLAALFATLTFLVACQSTKEEEETSLTAQLELSRQFIAAGDHKRAIANLHGVRREHPNDASVENMLGVAYMGIGDFSAAAASFKKSLEINNDNNDVRLNYAYALIVLKRYSAAREALDDIVDSSGYPYMERVYVNYGLSYLEEKRCNLARVKFEKSLQLDPTFATAHFNQGKCYLLEKKYPQAITSFKKASDFCPTCIDPIFELSRAYYLSGKKRLAVERIESLLRGKLDRVSKIQAQKLLSEFKR